MRDQSLHMRGRWLDLPEMEAGQEPYQEYSDIGTGGFLQSTQKDNEYNVPVAIGVRVRRPMFVQVRTTSGPCAAYLERKML